MIGEMISKILSAKQDLRYPRFLKWFQKRLSLDEIRSAKLLIQVKYDRIWTFIVKYEDLKRTPGGYLVPPVRVFKICEVVL